MSAHWPRTAFLSRPRHLVIGKGFSTWCGIHGVWDRGLSYTRDEAQMSCGNCRRSFRAFNRRQEQRARKNVTPPRS